MPKTAPRPKPALSRRPAAKRPERRVEQGVVVVRPPARVLKPRRAPASAAMPKPRPVSKAARKPKRGRARYSADSADKYVLYQKAVQAPELDVRFCERVYRAEYSRDPLHLREDFCGTALISSEWLRRGRERTAEGFDIDPEPVAWGLAHNFGRDKPQARDVTARFSFHLKDVRAPGDRAPHVRIAFNFSYWVFKTRDDLLAYFRAAHDSLADEGLFLIDLYGGSDATEEQEDRRRCGGFTYIWHQAQFWPGTGDYRCHIRFRFPDGRELKAFSYDWRFWTLTELRDVLRDAGFARVDAYFEGSDKHGEGDGRFRRGVRGENCAAWVAYLVGVK